MTKAVESAGKTIDEAISLALSELGADRDSVSVEILETPSKGFLGIGSIPAKVRVTMECADSVGGLEFLKNVFEKMKVNVEINTEASDGEMKFMLKGSEMGAVIGRRGETLDALQYLTSLVINRGQETYTKVTIDTENYRKKREETLVRLATKLAGKVQRYRKSITLEPMNPYERRIIHATLQDVQGVTTYSTGSEPNRRVVIALENSKSRGARRFSQDAGDEIQ